MGNDSNFIVKDVASNALKSLFSNYNIDNTSIKDVQRIVSHTLDDIADDRLYIKTEK